MSYQIATKPMTSSEAAAAFLLAAALAGANISAA